jgi:hypothetical protein
MVQRTVKNENDLALLKVYLDGRKRPFTVDITEGRDRSTEQNRLSHKWYREISDQTGEEIEDVLARCKLKYGLPILMRSSEAFRDLCRRRIKPLTHAERVEVIRDFDIPITRLMKVDQMTRYLDEMFRHHAEFGIALTVPEDRYAYNPEKMARAA